MARLTKALTVRVSVRSDCPCPEKSSLGGGLERCKSDLVAKALELSEAAAL